MPAELTGGAAMQVHEDARVERLYREIRTLTAMRLRAVAAADWTWVDVLEWKRNACRDALSACALPQWPAYTATC